MDTAWLFQALFHLAAEQYPRVSSQDLFLYSHCIDSSTTLEHFEKCIGLSFRGQGCQIPWVYTWCLLTDLSRLGHSHSHFKMYSNLEGCIEVFDSVSDMLGNGYCLSGHYGCPFGYFIWLPETMGFKISMCFISVASVLGRHSWSVWRIFVV